MTMTMKEVKKLKFIDKVILHCHDQSLYLVSIMVGDTEHYIGDGKGRFLRSFNKLELQSRFADLNVGAMVLRHQSPYDEMVGMAPNEGDNTLEVLIGGLAYAAGPKPGDAVH